MMQEHLRDADEPVGLVPPQDLDAEQACLGALLMGSPSDDVLSMLKPSDFYRDAHADIFAACQAVAESGSVDQVMVAGHLRDSGRLEAVGGLGYIDRLCSSVPFSERALRYAQRVLDRSQRRAMLTAARRLQHNVCDSDVSIAELQEEARRSIVDGIAGPPAAYVAGADLWVRWAEHTRDTCDPVTTGFAALDESMGGGWHRAQAHILTAKSGKGKSALVCCFAIAALRAGRRVGIVSREMETWEVMARLLSIASGLPYRSVEWGEPGPTEWVGGRLACDIAVETMNDPLWAGLAIDDDPDGQLASVGARMRDMRERHGADLIVVDHAGLVYPPQWTNEYEKQIAVSAAMNTGARRLGCPVLVVMQQRVTRGMGADIDAIKGGSMGTENAPLVLTLNPNFDDVVPTATLEAQKVRGGKVLVGHRAIQLVGDYDTMAWRVEDDVAGEPTAGAWLRDPKDE